MSRKDRNSAPGTYATITPGSNPCSIIVVFRVFHKTFHRHFKWTLVAVCKCRARSGSGRRREGNKCWYLQSDKTRLSSTSDSAQLAQTYSSRKAPLIQLEVLHSFYLAKLNFAKVWCNICKSPPHSAAAPAPQLWSNQSNPSGRRAGARLFAQFRDTTVFLADRRLLHVERWS